jgi:glycosyltransferase involved in cell wall biosynthesis
MQTQRKKFCVIKHATYPANVRTRKEAESLANAGHQVDVVFLQDHKDQPRREQINGVNVYRIPLQHKRQGLLRYLYEYTAAFLMFGWMITFLHLHRRYDAIQFSNMPDFLIFATFVPKLMGAKIIFDLHECMPEIYQVKYKIGPNHLVTRILRQIERMAIAYSDYLLTCNAEMQRIFVERGAPADRFLIFFNTPNESIFKPLPQQKDDPDSFILVTHGAIEERYGHDVAINAVALLRDKIPGLRLDIFGDGSACDQYEHLSKSLGLDDIVSFRGYVPIDDLVQSLNNADVGLITMPQPYEMRWVHTSKMFDYMAIRKPIVMTRVKAVEEYFDDSCLQFFHTGDAEDLARAVLELYQNPQRRRELVANAGLIYDQNKWSVQSVAYCKTMESLTEPVSTQASAA